MCGIIGYTNAKGKHASPAIIAKIMRANDKRGGHSTGFYDGTFFKKCIGKSAALGFNLAHLQTNEFIGHTRFATHGNICLPNQHPFKYGNVIGAHNGVVHNYAEVGDEFNVATTEVDSQMIFKVLNITTNDKKLCGFDALGMFSGALATLFVRDGRYYAYRHTNPLFVGKGKNGGLYFSSIRSVLKQCKLQDTYKLKEGRLYEFLNGRCINKFDIKHKPVASPHNATNRQWYDYAGWGYGTGYAHGITDDFDITDTDKVEKEDEQIAVLGNSWQRGSNKYKQCKNKPQQSFKFD